VFKRRKRLGVQEIVFIAVLLFVLFAIIFPAAGVLIESEAPPTVEFEITSEDKISVFDGEQIIDMPLEEYIACVVAAEMPASYEFEALKAQAVAARTFAQYKRQHGGCDKHSGADVCTDSNHCQAYLSPEAQQAQWDDNAAVFMDKIRMAVAETAGEVLLYDGEAIQVLYHACSGGMTENSENVYPQALPYLVGVVSEGEQQHSRYYGEVTVSAEDFEAAMKNFSPSIRLSGVQIGQIKRFESGRVESIEIGNETFTGREVRSVFSLNSANFTVSTGDSVTFSTIGFGHGVGMSQAGAGAMAQRGATYEEILKHYYTGVTIAPGF